MQIQNPILPGFNPDPSIVRVGDDYEGLDGGYLGSDVCGGFVGAYIGMFCTAETESETEAAFDCFEYLPR